MGRFRNAKGGGGGTKKEVPKDKKKKSLEDYYFYVGSSKQASDYEGKVILVHPSQQSENGLPIA